LLETKLPHNRNTHLISHGVDVDHFRKACLAETAIPADCPVVKGPVIGFFGLVADWVDLEVIRYIAEARPEWTVLMVGAIRTDTSALRSLPNVHMLGRRDYDSLPGYCKAFSVAILPFVVNGLTLAANPLKLREYLAAGLPVVATPLPEVRKLGSLVRTALTPEDFLREVDASLNNEKHGPDRSISQCMDGESWDARVEELSGHIESLRSDSKRSAPANVTEQVA
jgi:glycosyltransferase involved in cell wall biosynthesis